MADIILSSGYLGFARHIGFLKALEEKEISIDAICGTSSGAIIGALYCAGYSVDEISKLIIELPPIKYVRFNLKFWQGFFSLQPFIDFISTKIPKKFEDLKKPLAVGVCTYYSRKYKLLHSGLLAPSITASGAVPKLFNAVEIDGIKYIDAAVVDRLGLADFKKLRPGNNIIIHNIESSQKKVTVDKKQHISHLMVRTPRTKASLRRLNYFYQEIEEAFQLSCAAL